MKYIKFFKYILNKKEKVKVLYISILMALNTMLELLSVGLILPVITILMKKDLNFLPENLYEITKNFEYFDLLKIVLSGLVIIYVFKNLFIFFYNYQQSLFLKNLHIRIVSDLFKRYIFQNYSFFLQKDTGSILRNLNISRIVSLCLVSYLTLALELSVISCFLIYILYLNFSTSFIIILIFVSFGLILYKTTRKKLHLWGSLKQDYDAKMNQQIIQSFTLIKNIKIFNKEKKIFHFFKDLILKSEDLIFKTDIVQQLPRVLAETLGVISIAILIILLTISGKSNSEIITLTAVYAAVAFRLIPASTRIIAALQRIKNFAPSLALIKGEFLSLEPKGIKTNEVKKIEPIKFNNIKLKKVSFSYDKKDDIFANINLQINKGDIIGLYGESGSGKSTLINLISGLIEPYSGTILINDNLLKNNKENWLASLGYVPQQVTLFNDSITKNISFFEEEIEKKKINSILDKSNLTKFINSLPDKGNTIVGESSSKLSGGQIQRIGIARALFNDPEFIIFDESTNSLDTINENEIMEFIYSLKDSKTVLIISHDKKVLDRCDKIYEVKNKNINQIK